MINQNFSNNKHISKGFLLLTFFPFINGFRVLLFYVKTFIIDFEGLHKLIVDLFFLH